MGYISLKVMKLHWQMEPKKKAN
uniref:Uncharacterized protein n=1 Tax=Arundo donax TaxID=35708 RepID=A0A0A9C4L3_ARUDO